MCFIASSTKVNKVLSFKLCYNNCSRARPATQKSTTVSVSSKTTVDRIRRPYNRPRSRATSTTEEQRETTGSYEPTRGKVSEERYTAAPEVKQTPRIRPVQTKTLPTRVRGSDKTVIFTLIFYYAFYNCYLMFEGMI